VFLFFRVAERADPYLRRVRSYYRTLGYGTLRMGKVCAGAMAPVARAAGGLPRDHRYDGSTLPARQWDQSTANYNAAATFYSVYSVDMAAGHDLGISYIAIDGKHTTGEDRHVFSARGPVRATASSRRKRGNCAERLFLDGAAPGNW
jgi:hypothetical protein